MEPPCLVLPAMASTLLLVVSPGGGEGGGTGEGGRDGGGARSDLDLNRVPIESLPIIDAETAQGAVDGQVVAGGNTYAHSRPFPGAR